MYLRYIYPGVESPRGYILHRKARSPVGRGGRKEGRRGINGTGRGRPSRGMAWSPGIEASAGPATSTFATWATIRVAARTG